MAIGYLPTWAIYFTLYERAKSIGSTSPWLKDHSWVVHTLSAMCAGMTSTVATNPIWVVKTRLMTQYTQSTFKYKNTPEAFRTIYQQEGIRAFYRGLGPSMFGVLHVAVQFPLYEGLKPLLSRGHRHSSTSNEASWSSILVASAIAKMIASSLTYPHEVVRTRLQNVPIYKKGSPSAGGAASETSVGLWQMCRNIYVQEGWRAFYAGMGTNLIRTVPASAVTLLTFEIVSKRLFMIKTREHGRRSSQSQMPMSGGK